MALLNAPQRYAAFNLILTRFGMDYFAVGFAWKRQGLGRGGGLILYAITVKTWM